MNYNCYLITNVKVEKVGREKDQTRKKDLKNNHFLGIFSTLKIISPPQISSGLAVAGGSQKEVGDLRKLIGNEL